MTRRVPFILLAGVLVGALVWLVWVYPFGAMITEPRSVGGLASAAFGLALIRHKLGTVLPGAAGAAMVLGFGLLWTLEASSTDETGLFIAALMVFSVPAVIAGAAADLTVAKLVETTRAKVASG